MCGNPTLFHRAKSSEKNIKERQILTQSIEKSFLIDRATTINTIYRDSLTLRIFSIVILLSKYDDLHFTMC